MRTYIRLTLAVLAVGIPAWALSQTAPPPQGRTSGRVLILKNYRAIEGDVERLGDEFRVRRANGEMLLPADRVLQVCAGWDEALAVMSRQANLRDPDERLRLAKWCQSNGLLEQAVEQASEAVRMRPEHRESKNLLTLLLRTAEASKHAPTPAPAAPQPGGPPPTLDLTGETLVHFTTRIQPILMNTCASCHAGSYGGTFKLVRCTDATLNRRGLQQNVAAVLAQVNLDKPELSPLLIKAVAAHGGVNQPPIAKWDPVARRESRPFQSLREWVSSVGTENPHLKHVLSPHKQDKTASTEPPRRLPDLPAGALNAPAAQAKGTIVAPVVSTERAVPAAAQVPADPKQTPAAIRPGAEQASKKLPDDEFDAAIYNQMVHPQK